MNEMLETITMEEIFDAVAKTATKMCNPDKYKFLVEWLGEDVIVNCYGLCDYYSSDLAGYAGDLAYIVTDLLNKHEACEEGYEWHCHSEPNYYDKDGDTCDEDGPVDCVQYQIYKIADGL